MKKKEIEKEVVRAMREYDEEKIRFNYGGYGMDIHSILSKTELDKRTVTNALNRLQKQDKVRSLVLKCQTTGNRKNTTQTFKVKHYSIKN